MSPRPTLPPGVYHGVPAATYHADPCGEPSASSSVLRSLLDTSPEHARHGHPRLNPAYVARPATDAQNRGTILHSMLLETPEPFVELRFPDFKTARARDARDAAIAAGLIPVPSGTLTELRDVASAVRARLQAMPEVWAGLRNAVDARATEVAMVWREQGVLCRALLDTLPDARFRALYDFKFTILSAAPEPFGRKVVGEHAMQADLYPRAVRALRGDRPEMVFIACEQGPPYGVSLHALDPVAATIARERVDEALALWKECFSANRWPSYSARVHYQSVPPWVARAWEARGLAQEGHALLQGSAT